MILGYADFKNRLKEKQIKMHNERFDKTIQKFDVLDITSFDKTNQQIHDYISKSEVIIIDKNTNNEIEYILCIKSDKTILKVIYSINKVYKVPKISSNQFYKELDNFKRAFKIKIEKEDIKKFWSIINPSIAAYLIKQSYLKTYKDRINRFIKNIYQIELSQIKNFEQNEFKFELKSIG